jgi:hypothetical protein
MKGHFLFISDTYSMLVVPDFFPRSDDWLGKRGNLNSSAFISEVGSLKLILHCCWYDQHQSSSSKRGLF